MTVNRPKRCGDKINLNHWRQSCFPLFLTVEKDEFILMGNDCRLIRRLNDFNKCFFN